MAENPFIYLVDDDDSVRRSIGFMLKTSGFSVRAYPSGIDFLKDVKALDPGCILLDIRMPDMDGLEVQRELAARGIAMPVIVLTGHGDVATAVEAMKNGASVTPFCCASFMPGELASSSSAQITSSMRSHRPRRFSRSSA